MEADDRGGCEGVKKGINRQGREKAFVKLILWAGVAAGNSFGRHFRLDLSSLGLPAGRR